MRSSISLLLLLALVAVVSACSGNGPIYPDAVYTDNPKITTIAVAPFIMPEEAVKRPSKKFTPKYFEAKDGTTIYYSVDFAAEYARGLAKFPGVKVIMPADVERRWIQSIKTGKTRNPLSTAAEAREIGASLQADAILVATVVHWDAFKPDLNMSWQLLATNRGGSGASVIDGERAGTGGQASTDYTKVPVFSQTASLNAEDAAVAKRLEIYGEALQDFAPYETPSEFIRHQPWPRYLHFAAWATMRDAYAAHKPRD